MIEDSRTKTGAAAPPAASYAEDPFRHGVILMAMAIVCLILIAAYFTDRQGGDDELSLFNPVYTALHYGKATYPAYGFPNSMPVHPPVHYMVIAGFMRAGFTLYYAEAMPTVLLLLLCVWLIVTSNFSSVLKIALLFGLWLPYVFFTAGMELFGMRPEGDLNAAWIAGLLALESGRQRGWKLPRLILGSLLITYAAGLHYYAPAAVLGVAVYGLAAFRKLGSKRSRPIILALGSASLVYGFCEVALWAIPQRRDIASMIIGTAGGGSIAGTIKEHVNFYHYWGAQASPANWLRFPLLLGIPVILISTPILLTFRQTRVFALGALPLPLFVLVLALHKHAYYYVHEIGLYGTAIAAVLLTILGFVLHRLPRSLPGRVIALAAVAFLVLTLWEPTISRSPVRWSLTPRIHEHEIARAAARAILGYDAHVASRLGMWYASGAESWYNYAPKLLGTSTISAEEVASYLGRFDGVADTQHMSNATSNPDHKVLLSWYLEGALKLRGFFFSISNSALSYLVFQTNPGAAVHGFGLNNERLYEFYESASGDREMSTLVGSYSFAMPGLCQQSEFCNVMTLPDNDTGINQVLVSVVMRGHLSQDRLPPNCRFVQQVILAVRPADIGALVKASRRSDKPIRFYFNN
jgi:hypothetical protein